MIDPQFLAWHQQVGGRTVLGEIGQALNRPTLEGAVLYHAFFPNTRVMHVVFVDRVLLTNQPAEDVLGLATSEDHPELDGILTCLLTAANDVADEFGEEHRRPDQVTRRMRDFFQRSFVRHLGTGRLQGKSFVARTGIGLPGPANWVLHGWSLTAS